MKRYLFIIACICLYISSKAQSEYIDTNYKITYTLKLQEVYTEQQAKSASTELVRLFDSNHQLFRSSDSTISIRSAFDANDSILIGRLIEYGYSVKYFKKTLDPIPLELKKREE